MTPMTATSAASTMTAASATTTTVTNGRNHNLLPTVRQLLILCLGYVLGVVMTTVSPSRSHIHTHPGGGGVDEIGAPMMLLWSSLYYGNDNSSGENDNHKHDYHDAATTVVTESRRSKLKAGGGIGSHDKYGHQPPDWVMSDIVPPITRKDRFPSIQQRVELYMSNWYVPPCEDYVDGQIAYRYHWPKNISKTETTWPVVWIQAHAPDAQSQGGSTTEVLEMHSIVEPDKAFFIDRDTVLDCQIPAGVVEPHDDQDGGNQTRQQPQPALEHRVVFRKNMAMYCADVADTVLTAWDHVQWERSVVQDIYHAHNNNIRNDNEAPLIIQFGDMKQSHVYRYLNLPHLKKFRSGTWREALQVATTYNTAFKNQDGEDCSRAPRHALQTWHDTHYMQPVVWKLATHRHLRALAAVYRDDTAWDLKKNQAVFRGQLTGSRDGYDKDRSDEENCRNMRRCRLVYNHANSSLVDARLTSTRDRLPDVLNGVPLVTTSVSIRTLLQYKAIIMLEGNDVASGLKWAMLSQSVVLMPPPRHTSWAMEELLQPWVHYIPILDNGDDVEEKMRWILDHDLQAHNISQRGSLWMEDLVFHPDAAEDDRLIQEEILRRYLRYLVYQPSLQYDAVTAKQ